MGFFLFKNPEQPESFAESAAPYLEEMYTHKESLMEVVSNGLSESVSEENKRFELENRYADKMDRFMESVDAYVEPLILTRKLSVEDQEAFREILTSYVNREIVNLGTQKYYAFFEAMNSDPSKLDEIVESLPESVGEIIEDSAEATLVKAKLERFASASAMLLNGFEQIGGRGEKCLLVKGSISKKLMKLSDEMLNNGISSEKLIALVQKYESQVIIAYLQDELPKYADIIPKLFLSYSLGGSDKMTDEEAIRIKALIETLMKPEFTHIRENLNFHLEGTADSIEFKMSKDREFYLKNYLGPAVRMLNLLPDDPYVKANTDTVKGFIEAVQSDENWNSFVESNFLALTKAGGAMNAILAYKRVEDLAGRPGEGITDLFEVKKSLNLNLREAGKDYRTAALLTWKDAHIEFEEIPEQTSRIGEFTTVDIAKKVIKGGIEGIKNIKAKSAEVEEEEEEETKIVSESIIAATVTGAIGLKLELPEEDKAKIEDNLQLKVRDWIISARDKAVSEINDGIPKFISDISDYLSSTLKDLASNRNAEESVSKFLKEDLTDALNGLRENLIKFAPAVKDYKEIKLGAVRGAVEGSLYEGIESKVSTKEVNSGDFSTVEEFFDANPLLREKFKMSNDAIKFYFNLNKSLVPARILLYENGDVDITYKKAPSAKLTLRVYGLQRIDNAFDEVDMIANSDILLAEGKIGDQLIEGKPSSTFILKLLSNNIEISRITNKLDLLVRLDKAASYEDALNKLMINGYYLQAINSLIEEETNFEDPLSVGLIAECLNRLSLEQIAKVEHLNKLKLNIGKIIRNTDRLIDYDLYYKFALISGGNRLPEKAFNILVEEAYHAEDLLPVLSALYPYEYHSDASASSMVNVRKMEFASRISDKLVDDPDLDLLLSIHLTDQEEVFENKMFEGKIKIENSEADFKTERLYLVEGNYRELIDLIFADGARLLRESSIENKSRYFKLAGISVSKVMNDQSFIDTLNTNNRAMLRLFLEDIIPYFVEDIDAVAVGALVEIIQDDLSEKAIHAILYSRKIAPSAYARLIHERNLTEYQGDLIVDRVQSYVEGTNELDMDFLNMVYLFDVADEFFYNIDSKKMEKFLKKDDELSKLKYALVTASYPSALYEVLLLKESGHEALKSDFLLCKLVQNCNYNEIKEFAAKDLLKSYLEHIITNYTKFSREDMFLTEDIDKFVIINGGPLGKKLYKIIFREDDLPIAVMRKLLSYNLYYDDFYQLKNDIMTYYKSNNLTIPSQVSNDIINGLLNFDIPEANKEACIQALYFTKNLKVAYNILIQGPNKFPSKQSFRTLLTTFRDKIGDKTPYYNVLNKYPLVLKNLIINEYLKNPDYKLKVNILERILQNAGDNLFFEIHRLSTEHEGELVASESQKIDIIIDYGFKCDDFDRKTLFGMIEQFELKRDDVLKEAINRGVNIAKFFF
ncbi:hypothetical protein GF354_04900 [Candidatus Peregrinibacteria bacterium]|nr:hypothetical protein [Candidatus Peregrinibacteria bacterium]